ncbi:MAG: polymer-forming cytoskeletal protein [Massilibacteroides sp.]|nr:polymer-forming cytoskeletal protein [Massilibacteroides sp.]
MRNSKKNELDLSRAHNLLSEETVLKGNVVTQNDFRLDGTVEGDIKCGGRLVIGPKGFVKGTLEGVKIEVLGKIEGNIKASEILTLKASSSVTGDIYSAVLEIEPQANFDGKCHMNQKKSMSTVKGDSKEA